MSKSQWPEVEGLPWKEAEKRIRTDYPNITVQVLPKDSMATMDYREDRVRITIDGDNKVVGRPMIG